MKSWVAVAMLSVTLLAGCATTMEAHSAAEQIPPAVNEILKDFPPHSIS